MYRALDSTLQILSSEKTDSICVVYPRSDTKVVSLRCRCGSLEASAGGAGDEHRAEEKFGMLFEQQEDMDFDVRSEARDKTRLLRDFGNGQFWLIWAYSQTL